MSESKVKIQHRDRVGMQEATYILTPETKNPWLLFEGDADYLAVKQLQATIAEMGNVIGNDQAQIKFYRDAVADKDAEIANALKTSADRWQIIEELMAEKVELNLTIAKLQSKDTVSKEELDRLTHK